MDYIALLKQAARFRLQRAILASLLAICLVLGMAHPVFATSLPDSTPSTDLYFYRNLRETGDMLLVIFANIPYTTPPDDPVTSTFIWRLIDTDNVTELGACNTAYTSNDNGYGYNVYSMYWEAATAPTWNQAYTVRLSGSPAYFASPPVYNFSVGTSDYSSLTLQSAVRAELEAQLLIMAANLDTYWGLTATYSLLSATETGTVLSIYGEAVFRGAIYGLQAFAPDIFAFAISDLEITARTWTTGYSDNLTNQWNGTWVGTAKAAGATLFGTSFDMTSLLMVTVLCLGMVIGNIYLSKNTWAGMIDASFVLVVATRLGFFEMGYLMLIAAVLFLFTMAKVWFGGIFR